MNLNPTWCILCVFSTFEYNYSKDIPTKLNIEFKEKSDDNCIQNIVKCIVEF